MPSLEVLSPQPPHFAPHKHHTFDMQGVYPFAHAHGPQTFGQDHQPYHQHHQQHQQQHQQQPYQQHHLLPLQPLLLPNSQAYPTPAYQYDGSRSSSILSTAQTHSVSITPSSLLPQSPFDPFAPYAEPYIPIQEMEYVNTFAPKPDVLSPNEPNFNYSINQDGRPEYHVPHYETLPPRPMHTPTAPTLYENATVYPTATASREAINIGPPETAGLLDFNEFGGEMAGIRPEPIMSDNVSIAWPISAVENGVSALSLSRSHSPDLIVSHPGLMDEQSGHPSQNPNMTISTEEILAREDVEEIEKDIPGWLLEDTREVSVITTISEPESPAPSIPTAPSAPVYPCPITNCTKVFARPQNLRAHAKTHCSVKPHKCTYCELSFRRNHDLKRHMRLHNNERPYICPNCSKGFARSDALKRHVGNDAAGCHVPNGKGGAKPKQGSKADNREEESSEHQAQQIPAENSQQPPSPPPPAPALAPAPVPPSAPAHGESDIMSTNLSLPHDLLCNYPSDNEPYSPPEDLTSFYSKTYINSWPIPYHAMHQSEEEMRYERNGRGWGRVGRRPNSYM
ncbi:uncharacterized protein SPPG_09434 [Spizellomyces punctatus DAOM BR117]|uniref:C2H2-type domain-containing protein n=1 Tax=Spizellomyces punctatus (strain DAOM BR117) TaxID=645134 RepID=A0A0L0HA56_SPIPD|nr:uncharacterized protein SPPG_09434 [Spizellomyces punctatus DAOM BR117]KNC97553.1 hypothetical protein SPPG_09434 [Spizellomyces punctatus DAOM BR117]|eukprot:XP_016605593.1 hypothetical protein SPPG_09434 [Spizellomyces punctatus DAOM BR117]